jgi:putative transposase
MDFFSPPALAALRSAMPVIGGPYHPMTQGKIERYHRSMKNRILLENYYLPG